MRSSATFARFVPLAALWSSPARRNGHDVVPDEDEVSYGPWTVVPLEDARRLAVRFLCRTLLDLSLVERGERPRRFGFARRRFIPSGSCCGLSSISPRPYPTATISSFCRGLSRRAFHLSSLGSDGLRRRAVCTAPSAPVRRPFINQLLTTYRKVRIPSARRASGRCSDRNLISA